MSKKKFKMICCALALAGSLVGCVSNKEGQSGMRNVEVTYYKDFTDLQLFQEIPVMSVANGKTDFVGDMGAGNEIVTINGCELAEYWTYLDVLGQTGFSKYYDNGESGLKGKVYSATLIKDDLTVNVIYMLKSKLAYIVAEEDIALSDRLFYKDEYVEDNIEGAKTTLHLVELSDFGNSFVIQLKNGHFIINDGGRADDLPYLIEYLESLAPKGEKPVVEAWMCSHPHNDHTGAFLGFEKNWTYAERIYVDSIYMDTVNSDVAVTQGVNGIQLGVQTGTLKLNSSDGGHPEIYRPQAGHTYYFSDIKIEVMQTMIQVPEQNWYRWTGNINEFSTWLMYHIEDQTFLNAGDADFGAMRAIMRTYDEEDFVMDIMAVQHHGINVHNEFSDFITVKTLLYPNMGTQGMYKTGVSWGGSWQASEDRNEYLQDKALESICYIEGTQVLTFPYEIGSVKSLGNNRIREDVSKDETRIQYY